MFLLSMSLVYLKSSNVEADPLSPFVLHGFFAQFSAPFVNGISWIVDFKRILVFNESIPSSFAFVFAHQCMKHPAINE